MVRCGNIQRFDGSVPPETCKLDRAHVAVGEDHNSGPFTWPVGKATVQRNKRLMAVAARLISLIPEK